MERLRDDMIAEGYHFPNDMLEEVDAVIMSLGGTKHEDNNDTGGA